MAAGNQAGEGLIVTFTDFARQRLLEILDQQGLRGQAALRITVEGRGPGGFNYAFGLEAGPPKPGDVVQTEDGFKLYVDAETLPRLLGSTVDFVGQLVGGGFRVDNPNSPWEDPSGQAIQQLIDTQITPAVASHGGTVELVDVKDNKVYVRLGGGCQGCGMVDVTLRQGIEVMIKQAFPQIEEVVDVTDHAGGTAPFHQGAKGSSPFHQQSKG